MVGIVLVPDNSISYREFVSLACEAESAGISHVYIPEGLNDSLMCSYAIARETSDIGIVTYTTNIYYREPPLCAVSAQMVQEASEGRFTLGLGVGHRDSQIALGIDVRNPREKLRNYTTVLRNFLAGKPHPNFPVAVRTAEPPLPIHFAATTLETARLAGEIADGLELYLSTPQRTRACTDAANGVAAEHGRAANSITVSVGLPTFIDDDLDAARDRARSNLMYHLALPNYIRQLKKSGIEQAADDLSAAAAQDDADALRGAVSAELLDATCLVGPASRCLAQIETYVARAGGNVKPIVFPFPFTGNYVEGVREVIRSFGPAS